MVSSRILIPLVSKYNNSDYLKGLSSQLQRRNRWAQHAVEEQRPHTESKESPQRSAQQDKEVTRGLWSTQWLPDVDRRVSEGGGCQEQR
jgi:hypothetical protein